MVAGLDGELGLERVGEPGGALVELRVRQSSLAADDRFPVGNSVGDELEQVGNVERRYFASLPWLT